MANGTITPKSSDDDETAIFDEAFEGQSNRQNACHMEWAQEAKRSRPRPRVKDTGERDQSFIDQVMPLVPIILSNIH